MFNYIHIFNYIYWPNPHAYPGALVLAGGRAPVNILAGLLKVTQNLTSLREQLVPLRTTNNKAYSPERVPRDVIYTYIKATLFLQPIDFPRLHAIAAPL